MDQTKLLLVPPKLIHNNAPRKAKEEKSMFYYWGVNINKQWCQINAPITHGKEPYECHAIQNSMFGKHVLSTKTIPHVWEKEKQVIEFYQENCLKKMMYYNHMFHIHCERAFKAKASASVSILNYWKSTARTNKQMWL